MKKVVLAAVLCLGLCGCLGGGEELSDYDRINKQLGEMEGYRAVCEVAYQTNKGESTYVTEVSAERSGRYKLVGSEPEAVKDVEILFDGNMIWLYNPNVESKLQVAAKEGDMRRELILFTFLKNENMGGEESTVAAASVGDEKYITLAAEIPGGDKNYAREELFVEIKSGKPARLVIYDSEGNEYLTEEFSEFEYNPEFDEGEFGIDALNGD